MSAPGFKQYQLLVRERDDLKIRIAESRAWFGMRNSEHWELLEAWLRAQIESRKHYLVMGSARPSQDEFIETRAQIQMLSRLADAGAVSPSQLKAMEDHLQELNTKIAAAQRIGQDRDFSVPTN